MSANERLDSGDLRRCLGRFATGVTVVTCMGDQGPCGITANSFSSVSLEPPLILWNIAKVSNSLQAYLCAKYFAVNVLAADQQSLSNHFAQSDHTVFNGIDHEISMDEVPLLPDTLAVLECQTFSTYECGDHHIIVGEVLRFRSRDADPLVFFAGNYTGVEK